MVKICRKYYMIDAYVLSELIRPRKYCKEYTNTQDRWYDCNWNLVEDVGEIARLESQATPEREVEESYDEYMMFMQSEVSQADLVIPTDRHFIRVNWTPRSDMETIRMRTQRGILGDSYLVYVKNVGASPSILNLPVSSLEEGADPDPVSRIPVHADFVNITPKAVVAVRITYRDEEWYYEVISKPEFSGYQGGIVSIGNADFLTFRYLWTAEAGSDLDTATELVNSGIPGVDGNAVGWSCPGNNIPAVTSLLHWAGDNRSSGAECVYIDIKELREKYINILPSVTEFMTYATWFASKGTGAASFNLIAYKGGEMQQQGYNFVNTGGEEIYNRLHSFQVETIKGVDDYKNNYTSITKITYDKATNTVSMAVGETIIDNQNSMEEIYKLFGNYLSKDNAEGYTPTSDYNPSTKKYVDDGLDLKLNKNVVGEAGGVAKLDGNGKILVGEMPLGETDQTVYPGDKGKKNADDIVGLVYEVNKIKSQIGDIGTILDNINGEGI